MLKDFKITEIRPSGWLKHFLITQMNGLTGNIEQAGFPFNCVEWGKEDFKTENENPGWWVYEQTAYWLDGYLKCAILLDDKFAIEKASKIIYAVIENPDKDGYLGPSFMKNTDGWNRWPHVVFFRACMTLFDYTEDKKIVDALLSHYLGYSCPYDTERDVLNVEIMLWLYEKTGDNRLIDLAIQNYDRYNSKGKESGNNNCEDFALSNNKPYAHGVTYNEFAKLGAILYIHTKNEKYLAPSIKAYAKIDKYFMLPGGCHCSNEFLINNHYMQSHETCDITDYTWSLYYLAKATGNAEYFDKIEKCIFNAGIGSVLEDFKGLQYFSCCNQLVLDSRSNHNVFFCGDKWMSYRPNPGTECCPGNVNRFMPNFISKTWMKDESCGVYATAFGESVLTTEINGNKIVIEEKTSYPFNDCILFEIDSETDFDFYLRVPIWAKSCYINGKKQEAINSGFILVKVYNGKSKVNLEFNCPIHENNYNGGVYYQKGALLYSFGMKGERIIDNNEDRSTKEFPAYNIYPDKKWNYAIKTGNANFINEGCDLKWDLDFKLPYIEVECAEISNFNIKRKKKVLACTNLYQKIYIEKTGEFQFTPSIPKKFNVLSERRKLRLYPFGACKVRLTVLPIIKN